MEDITPAPEAKAPAETTTPEAAPEALETQIPASKADIEAMFAELDQLPSETPAVPVEETPTEMTEATPGETPAAEPVVAVEKISPEEKKDPRERLNPKYWDDEEGQRDFAAIQLANRRRRQAKDDPNVKPLTVHQAYEQLFGKASPATAATAQPGDTPAAEKTEAPTEQSIEAEIADLETQATKAAEEEFDLGKVRKLDKAIAAKQRELEALRASQQAQQHTASQAIQAAEQESYVRVLAEYPWVAEDGNPLTIAIQAEVDRVERLNPGFQERDPEWLEAVVAKVERKTEVAQWLKAARAAAPATPSRGATPATAQAATSPAAPAPEVPRPPAKPRAAVPAPAPGSMTRGESTPTTTDQQWSEVKQQALAVGDMEAAFAFLDEHGERDALKLLRGSAA